jgi:hypothetical protein
MLLTCSPLEEEVMIEMREIEVREIEVRELIEAELDGVAGGMINQDPDGTKRRPGPSAADIYQHPPIYLPKAG